MGHQAEWECESPMGLRGSNFSQYQVETACITIEQYVFSLQYSKEIFAALILKTNYVLCHMYGILLHYFRNSGSNILASML